MLMVKVRSLIRDHTLYPRERVDPEHVQRMIDAAAAGVAFPPIIAEAKTKRIVDGYHRLSMAERTVGLDGEVAVVFKSYKNDEDFFLDAIRYNADHGLTLSASDRMRSLKIADSLKISVEQTAGALRMSVHAAGKLTTAAVSEASSREPQSVTVSPRFSPRPQREPGELPITPRPDLAIIGSLDRVIHWLESAPKPESPQITSRLEKLRELLGTLQPA